MYLCVEALGSDAVEKIVSLADPGTRESLHIPLQDELDHNDFGISPTFATQHWKKLNPLFSLTSGPQGLHYKRPVISSYLPSTESSVVAVGAVPS